MPAYWAPTQTAARNNTIHSASVGATLQLALLGNTQRREVNLFLQHKLDMYMHKWLQNV